MMGVPERDEIETRILQNIPIHLQSPLDLSLSERAEVTKQAEFPDDDLVQAC